MEEQDDDEEEGQEEEGQEEADGGHEEGLHGCYGEAAEAGGRGGVRRRRRVVEIRGSGASPRLSLSHRLPRAPRRAPRRRGEGEVGVY